MGWVGRLVSLVRRVVGWGDVFLWSFFVLCLCFYALALYFDACSGTLFLDYEVDASFLSSFFLFSPFLLFPFLRFHFIS